MLITAIPMAGAPAYAASDDAIPISTPEELDTLVRANLSGNFILTQDINLTDYLSAGGPGYNGGAGWQPINNFRGILDGNGYTIRGLYINRPSESGVGLFGVLYGGARIHDLGMVDIDVRGNQMVGSLAGASSSSNDNIFNCYAKGEVAGLATVGGLVGQNYGLIRQSYSSCNVSSSGNPNVGGLVGSNYGRIWESYATGNVTSTYVYTYAGGLVGRNYIDASILDSYATGDVSGNAMLGGLAGYNQGSIVSSYTTGRVEKLSPMGYSLGGLVGGVSGGTIERSYWDIETSNQDGSPGGAGKSTTEMKTQSTFEDWDFTDVWSMDENPDSYPYLIWPVTPRIYSQPEDQTVNAGEPASFSVRTNTAAGEPVSYQWKKDDVDIAEATSATLTIEAAEGSDAATYTVEVSNGIRKVTSQPATLTINTGTDPVAPSITGQPQNQTVTIGQTATFTVTAAGSEPLNYKWKKDGSDIAGATSAMLNIVNAQTSDAGTYTVEVSNDAGKIISDPATLTVNETGALNLLLTPGDRFVRLDWSEVPETVSYYVYQDAAHVETVAGSVYSHEVTGLTNGQTYTFEIRAIDDNDDVIATSGNYSATPRTVPGAPTNVTATAGNGQATVSFSAPASNGGSPITGYTVTASPGNIRATGTSSPITVTGLDNGTSYTFTVKATNAAGDSAQSVPSNSVTPYKSSGGGSRGGSTPSTPPTTGLNITVNGKEGTIGTADTTKVGDKTIITVTIDDQQLAERLKQEGRKAVVTIPVTTKADVVIGRLNGQTVKNMEGQEDILEITANNVSYVLPAAQINIDSVWSQFGRQVELKDILIDVKIAAASQKAAAQNNDQMVVDPIEFVITAANAGKTVEISKFNAYVERIIALPEGVDASKITTGVVLNRDGSFSHVPTEVFEKDGKWYAKLNSLTNSTYSVIWNPVTVSSVENHWSKAYVNDMASRLVIKNPESFTPDGQITRGDFAEYVAKALGIYRTGVAKAGEFSDVSSGNELADAITMTAEYGIIAGYPDGTFRPEAKITREEAMIMYARAMDIVGLKEKSNNRIENYLDKQEISGWAYEGVKKTVSAGVFNGKTEATIDPKGMLTYAEAATAIRNLLTETKMINK